MTIRECLIELLKDKFAFNLRLGTVVAGSVAGGYCSVVPFDTETATNDPNAPNGPGIALEMVRIQSGTGNGISPVPAGNSVVIVGELAPSDYCILLYSELASIKFLDGSLGGLTEVINLTTKLNNIEKLLNKIVNSLNSWTPVPGDGGTALKTLITAAMLTDLTLTVRNDIENTLITHGN